MRTAEAQKLNPAGESVLRQVVGSSTRGAFTILRAPSVDSVIGSADRVPFNWREDYLLDGVAPVYNLIRQKFGEGIESLPLLFRVAPDLCHRFLGVESSLAFFEGNGRVSARYQHVNGRHDK